jgi:hypothetical protein
MKLDANVAKILGAGVAIAIGLVDHWFFKSSFGANFDSGLIGAGLGSVGLSIGVSAGVAGVTKLQGKG